MKRLILLTVVVFTVLCSMNFSVSADSSTVLATIPDYQIVIDNSSVYYSDSLYPFLNYKGITYLPMTYEYARAMNLTTGWLEGTAFMVAYNPCDDGLPVYEATTNQKYNYALVPTDYDVYVNGKKSNNASQEYPLINFRGVTYFPLTWEYAVENFGWHISFENNIFNIYTENNTADRWSVEEKRKNDAVLSFYYGKEIPSDDGNINHDWITEYYSLDYNTGNLIQLYDYTQKESNNQNNTQFDVTVDDGYVYYNGQKLDDIYVTEASKDYVKPDDVIESQYDVSAFTSDLYTPLEVVDVRVNTYNYGENSSWGRKENYTYIKTNNGLISLGLYKTVENVYELDGNIYFNTVDYGQTIFRHYLQNRKMWKLSKDGQLTEISYADYNSIKIIGKANEKLYLKCMWSPENHMEDAPFSVSLVNDGYYIFDGEGIRFISPYIYSDFDIVTNDGNIFAVNNVLDKIIKCEINPEYY
ncbi:MAG: hypothetical protein E7394_05840 [Ruminococcaceae bacterium]|nr:hypothetical protein [Oscillospiraceae bacterium]